MVVVVHICKTIEKICFCAISVIILRFLRLTYRGSDWEYHATDPPILVLDHGMVVLVLAVTLTLVELLDQYLYSNLLLSLLCWINM